MAGTIKVTCGFFVVVFAFFFNFFLPFLQSRYSTMLFDLILKPAL